MIYRKPMLLLAGLGLAFSLFAGPGRGAEGADAMRVKLTRLGEPDQSGAIGKELSHLMQRQLGADLRERVKPGPHPTVTEKLKNPTGGARHGEAEMRPYGSLIFGAAVALRVAKYDETATGIPAAEMEQTTISLAEDLAAHHIANNPTKTDWWWGDEWQSAIWAANAAKGSWLLWDKLSEKGRRDIVRMVIFEANRFLGSPAPFNEYFDTKAEENAWNSQIITLAYNMLPDHPNNAAWGEKGIEYMVTAFAAPQDLKSERIVDGRPLKEWLRGPNVHRDYTLENHGFFHPDYLGTYSMNVNNIAVYRLGGNLAPESTLFNVIPCRELDSFFTLPNGWQFYPVGTDWSNYRHDVSIEIQTPSPVLPNAVSTRCLLWTLDFLKYADKHATEVEKSPVSKNMFRGINFECNSLRELAEVYLMHALFGPGAEPLTERQAAKRLAGTRLLPGAKLIVSRSEDGIASFSWFDSNRRLMGAIAPLAKNVVAVPKARNLVGVIGKQVDNTKTLNREVRYLPGGGFSVGVSLLRGPELGMKERLMMLTLRDGRTIYAEWFDYCALKNPGEIRTATFDLETNPFWLRGAKLEISHPGGVWVPQPGEYFLPTGKGYWLNANDRFGAVVFGSNRIRILNTEIALNYHAEQALREKLPTRVVSLFLPKATREQTAAYCESVKIRELEETDAVAIDLGDATVLLNPTDAPVKTTFGRAKIELAPLAGVVVRREKTPLSR